jgi:hypothetical protein
MAPLRAVASRLRRWGTVASATAVFGTPEVTLARAAQADGEPVEHEAGKFQSARVQHALAHLGEQPER